MGLSLDWRREIATCDPAYYRHQQRMFLDFLEAGLVDRKTAKVNWDPVDQTVLANEQVIDGRGWRSGALVEQRELTQWFFKITDYAQELLDALDTLDRWPEKVRLMQQQLDRPLGGPAGPLRARPGDDAGRRDGARDLHDAARHAVRRELHGARARPSAGEGRRREATRRSPPSSRSASAPAPPQEAIEKAEKKGFDTGIRAVHPLRPDWELPVYVANFILMDYGTGAIFGCPAHDQRDLDFANKYGLGNTPGGLPAGRATRPPSSITDVAYDGDGRMINSRFLDGMTIDEAKEEVARRLETRDAAATARSAERKVNFRLRDWGISRQRYWGCPIPVIHCDDCGVVPVPSGPAGDAAGGRLLRRAGQPARPPSDLEARRLPAMRQGRRGARPTPWTPSSIRPGTSRASPTRRSRTSRPIAPPSTAGCRSTSTSAASSTRSCTCSIRASSPAR